MEIVLIFFCFPSLPFVFCTIYISHFCIMRQFSRRSALRSNRSFFLPPLRSFRQLVHARPVPIDFFLLFVYHYSNLCFPSLKQNSETLNIRCAPRTEPTDMRLQYCCLSAESIGNRIKTGMACFYRRGSSATLRLGHPLFE